MERRGRSEDARPRTARICRSLTRSSYKRKWWGARGVFAHKVASYSESVDDAILDEIEMRVEAVLAKDLTPRSIKSIEASLSGAPRCGQLASYLGVDSLETLLEGVVARSAVPYLPASVLKDAGLHRRALWERTWDLQRREDAGEKLDAPSPFRRSTTRRTTATPSTGASAASSTSPRSASSPTPAPSATTTRARSSAGPAGTTSSARRRSPRSTRSARKRPGRKDRLAPLLAGLLELVPWLKQWHNEPNAAFGGQRLGDYFDAVRRVRGARASASRSTTCAPGGRRRRRKGSRKGKNEVSVLQDVLKLPREVRNADFVVRIAEGVAHPASLLDRYAVTPDIHAPSRTRWSSTQEAVIAKASRGAYVHGSFGAGKSQFMGVLSLLLGGTRGRLEAPGAARPLGAVRAGPREEAAPRSTST